MSAVQCVVGTLEVAFLIVGMGSTVQRIQVQAADEAYLLGYKGVAMHIADMGLGDGVTPLGTVQLRILGIYEVNVAVVAHGEVLHLQRLHPEVKHGEVADGSLCLSAL